MLFLTFYTYDPRELASHSFIILLWMNSLLRILQLHSWIKKKDIGLDENKTYTIVKINTRKTQIRKKNTENTPNT